MPCRRPSISGVVGDRSWRYPRARGGPHRERSALLSFARRRHGRRILLAPVVMALVLARSDTASAAVFFVAAATDIGLEERLAYGWASSVPGRFLQHDGRQAARHRRPRRPPRRGARVAVGRPRHRRARARHARPAGRRGRGRQPTSKPRRSASGRRPCSSSRSRPRDAPSRRRHRRRIPRRVGHGSRGPHHRLVGRSTTSGASPPRYAARGEPRLRDRRERPARRRARRTADRARRRGRRARPLRRRRGRAGGPRRRVVRGDVLDEEAMVRGMDGAAVAFHVAASTRSASTTPSPCGASTSTSRSPRYARPRGRRAAAGPHLLGGHHRRAAGNFGRRRRRIAAGTFELRAHEDRGRARRAGRRGEDRPGLVCVNPSSVQGPGRAAGTARFLLAFLDGRLKVFVKTHVSLVDIADCVEGHLLAAERGHPGERYLLNGMTLTIVDALALAADVAGVRRRPQLLPRRLATVAAAAVERGAGLLGRRPPVPGRWPLHSLHGHRYDGSRTERAAGPPLHRRRARPSCGRSGGRARAGAPEEHLGRRSPPGSL